jgi:transposase
MQLTEQHVIERADPRFAAIDAACFKSKNLYNAGLYELRQAFFADGTWLRYAEMDKRMQSHEAYKALPAKVSQQVLKQLDDAWTSFFEACKAYKEDPAKFTGWPRLPKYKDKAKGRNLLIYTEQAVSKKGLKRGLIQPSLLAIEVQTKQKEIKQVRIVPHKGFYTMEVVYEKEVKQAEVNPAYYAGIDMGIDVRREVA